MSNHLSVKIALLDKQLVDSNRLPFGRVDDLLLSESSKEDGPRVEALLTGAQALGERLGGSVGGWMAAAAARFRPRSGPKGPTRIDPSLVTELEPFVQLSVRFEDLREVAALERWLSRHLIEPLPGAGDASE